MSTLSPSVLWVGDVAVLILGGFGSWSKQIVEHERAVAAKEAAARGTQ